jgi:hypothetical protein
MNPLLNHNGEIELLVESARCNSIDKLDAYQADTLLTSSSKDFSFSSSNCLSNIDYIATEWMSNLTSNQWGKIKRQKSLFGVPLPDKWIKVWRFILKEPMLRNAERAIENGANIGSHIHLWNLWSEECLEKHASKLDKELIEMVDKGFLYCEIGDILSKRYGDEFWCPRKETSKTTLSQVVNNYLYWKIPNKIVRAELLDLCLQKLSVSTKE